MLRVKIKITGERPNLDAILRNLPILDCKYNSVGDAVFLDLIANNQSTITEAVRRLGPKLNRKTTHVEVLSKEETLNKSFSYIRERVRTRNIGWKSKLLMKGYTLYQAINRGVVMANNLAKGKELYSYEADDETGRPIIITYIDGMPKDAEKEIDITTYATFIAEQDERIQKVAKRARYQMTKPKKQETEYDNIS